MPIGIAPSHNGSRPRKPRLKSAAHDAASGAQPALAASAACPSIFCSINRSPTPHVPRPLPPRLAPSSASVIVFGVEVDWLCAHQDDDVFGGEVVWLPVYQDDG